MLSKRTIDRGVFSHLKYWNRLVTCYTYCLKCHVCGHAAKLQEIAYIGPDLLLLSMGQTPDRNIVKRVTGCGPIAASGSNLARHRLSAVPESAGHETLDEKVDLIRDVNMKGEPWDKGWDTANMAWSFLNEASQTSARCVEEMKAMRNVNVNFHGLVP